MLSWRWGGAVLGGALVAAISLFWSASRGQGGEIEAAPVPDADAGFVLTGYLEAPGIDRTRLEALCTPMRLEAHPTIRRAALDSAGKFVLAGLSDVDYRIEVVLRTNPALVLATRDFVRPGRDELFIQSDLERVFGPSTSPDSPRVEPPAQPRSEAASPR